MEAARTCNTACNVENTSLTATRAERRTIDTIEEGAPHFFLRFPRFRERRRTSPEKKPIQEKNKTATYRMDEKYHGLGTQQRELGERKWPKKVALSTVAPRNVS